MTEELKRCPFCGGKCICVNVGIYAGKSHESVTIKCDDCGASIWGVTEEKAIVAWNRRTHYDELCEENEKLRELCRSIYINYAKDCMPELRILIEYSNIMRELGVTL